MGEHSLTIESLDQQGFIVEPLVYFLATASLVSGIVYAASLIFHFRFLPVVIWPVGLLFVLAVLWSWGILRQVAKNSAAWARVHEKTRDQKD